MHLPGRTFLFIGHFCDKPVKVMFDCGATDSYISHETYESLTNTDTEDLAEPLSVVTATGELTQVTRQVRSPIRLGKFTAPVAVKILPQTLPDVDIICGMDFLSAHDARLSCKTLECSIGPQQLRLRSLDAKRVSSNRSPLAYLHEVKGTLPLCTAKQANKALRNGGSATLLFITETGQPQSQIKPSYNAKALQLLREFPDTFESITQCPSQQFEMSNLLQLEPNHKPPYRRPFRLSLQEKIEVDR